MNKLKVKNISQIKPVNNMCIVEYLYNFTEEQLKRGTNLFVDNTTKKDREMYVGKIVSIKDKVFRDKKWIPTDTYLNKDLLYTPLRAIEIKDENNKIYHLIPSEDLMQYEVVKDEEE